MQYTERESVEFPVMSASQAAKKGLWTIIGPDTHCLVGPEDDHLVREALSNTKKHWVEA